jgi:hypothetical protein
MTEAERAFEAWWEKRIACEPRQEESMRVAFLAGWKRERPRAKPLVMDRYARAVLWGLNIDKEYAGWIRDQYVPFDTRIRVTVEEVGETTQQG